MSMSSKLKPAVRRSASWEDCSTSRVEKCKNPILGENSVKRHENFMDDLVMHALLENLILKDSLNTKRDHLRNKKEPFPVSPGRKIPRQSINDRKERKSVIAHGRRSSCIIPAETIAYSSMQALAEDFPELASKIRRLESYRESLLNERESSIKLLADVKAENEESLKDAQQPSDFDIADLPLNQRSVLQGSLNYESILQTLLQYQQMNDALAEAFKQSAHEEAISLDKQLRMLRTEIQDEIERRKEANCWEI